MNYADGRGGRVGERCGWCCGENCNAQGGTGGDNKCEPISFLEENGLVRYRATGGYDNCSPPTELPTFAPTNTPTNTPTMQPSMNPTAQPSEKPTMMPTEDPTESPTQAMIAPNPAGSPAAPGVPALQACTVGPAGLVPMMGQCFGEGITQRLCCENGAECMDITPFFSQCQRVVLAAGLEGSSSSSAMSMQTVLIVVAVVFLLALCCGTLLVYKLCIAKDSDDSYRKHNSLSDRDTRGRYDDRHERRRKDKNSRRRSESPRSRKKEKRSRDSRSRSRSRSPKRTDSGGSWVEDA